MLSLARPCLPAPQGHDCRSPLSQQHHLTPSKICPAPSLAARLNARGPPLPAAEPHLSGPANLSRVLAHASGPNAPHEAKRGPAAAASGPAASPLAASNTKEAAKPSPDASASGAHQFNFNKQWWPVAPTDSFGMWFWAALNWWCCGRKDRTHIAVAVAVFLGRALFLSMLAFLAVLGAQSNLVGHQPPHG